MTIRRLQPEEWEKVQEIFHREFNENPPHPRESMVVVAEEKGQIVGLGTLQWVPHIEPFWVKESHRGRFIVPLLVQKVFELAPALQYAFAYVKEPRMGKLLEKFGMKEMSGWKTYRWLRKEVRNGKSLRAADHSTKPNALD